MDGYLCTIQEYWRGFMGQITSTNSVYIGCKEKEIFIPIDDDTPKDVLSTLLECMINMVNGLFEPKQALLLIFTKYSSK